MTGVLVPPLKMQGIKTKIVPLIRESAVWDGEGKWVEPFVGSTVVPMNINPDRALLGDTNCHLIHFYQAVQRSTLTASSVREFLEREGAELLRDGQEHYYRVGTLQCQPRSARFSFSQPFMLQRSHAVQQKGTLQHPILPKTGAVSSRLHHEDMQSG